MKNRKRTTVRPPYYLAAKVLAPCGGLALLDRTFHPDAPPDCFLAELKALCGVLPERIQQVVHQELELAPDGEEARVTLRLSLFRLPKQRPAVLLNQVECEVRAPLEDRGPWSYLPPPTGTESNRSLAIFGPPEFVSVTAARMMQTAGAYWIQELFAAREQGLPVGERRAAALYRPLHN